MHLLIVLGPSLASAGLRPHSCLLVVYIDKNSHCDKGAECVCRAVSPSTRRTQRNAADTSSLGDSDRLADERGDHRLVRASGLYTAQATPVQVHQVRDADSSLPK